MPVKRKKRVGGRAPAVVRRWKSFFGVSCTHSEHVNKSAWARALEIKRDLKPDFTFHLGDFLDTAAFRAGAAGSVDETKSPKADLECGLFHLQQLEPQLILAGNHEDRLWRFLGSKNAIVADYAYQLIQQIDGVAKALRAELLCYKGVHQGVMMGPALLTHGTIYNVNAARDMAEMYGGSEVRFVIFGHTHTMAIGMARAAHGCMGINIGAMVDRREMEYAKNRRQTMAWQNGCITGEYCENDMRFQLHLLDREQMTFGKAAAA